MLVKGKISAIYPAENKISVILPEYDNAVTAPLPIYGGTKTAADYAVNEFLIVEVFNNNFNDAVIIGKASSSGAAYEHNHDDRYFTKTEWNTVKTITNLQIAEMIKSVGLK